jgi:hypothetical protein
MRTKQKRVSDEPGGDAHPLPTKRVKASPQPPPHGVMFVPLHEELFGMGPVLVADVTYASIGRGAKHTTPMDSENVSARGVHLELRRGTSEASSSRDTPELGDASVAVTNRARRGYVRIWREANTTEAVFVGPGETEMLHIGDTLDIGIFRKNSDENKTREPSQFSFMMHSAADDEPPDGQALLSSPAEKWLQERFAADDNALADPSGWQAMALAAKGVALHPALAGVLTPKKVLQRAEVFRKATELRRPRRRSGSLDGSPHKSEPVPAEEHDGAALEEAAAAAAEEEEEPGGDDVDSSALDESSAEESQGDDDFDADMMEAAQEAPPEDGCADVAPPSAADVDAPVAQPGAATEAEAPHGEGAVGGPPAGGFKQETHGDVVLPDMAHATVDAMQALPGSTLQAAIVLGDSDDEQPIGAAAPPGSVERHRLQRRLETSPSFKGRARPQPQAKAEPEVVDLTMDDD